MSNPSSRERAYQYIRQKIASGEITAGSSISELSLAKELGTSRTPVREAIGQMAAEGLLEQSLNRKPTVVSLTRRDIVELYEFREALEVYAVGKAARTAASRMDLEKLQRLAEVAQALKVELEQSGKPELNNEQMQRFLASDFGFHTLLMHIAANSRILKVVNEMRLLIRIFAMRRHGHSMLQLEQIYHQHCEIARAVVDQDAERAARIISEHIQISLRVILEDYDHQEIANSLLVTHPFFPAIHPSEESPK
jgi:DNA-binding GntR family transcriptional regulator